MVKKLTLIVKESTIAAAKRLAAENGTSVSAMFERLIVLLDSHKSSRRRTVRPATRRATALFKMAGDVNGRDVLEQALVEPERIAGTFDHPRPSAELQVLAS